MLESLDSQGIKKSYF